MSTKKQSKPASEPKELVGAQSADLKARDEIPAEFPPLEQRPFQQRRYFHRVVHALHVGKVLIAAEGVGLSLVGFASQNGSAGFLFIFQRTQDTTGSDLEIDRALLQ